MPAIDPKPQMGIRLPKDAEIAIKKIARRRSAPVAAIGREAIIEWLRTHGHLPPLDDDEPVSAEG